MSAAPAPGGPLAASGPLAGVRVVEVAGIGPAPFACMLLSDLGCEVIRVDRARSGELSPRGSPADVLNRGRRSVCVDLKSGRGVEVVLRLVERADALVEGFRPGVMERLGAGPEACLERNPRLVYGRMTGWGQHGPLSLAAGHDINYIALTGALGAIGRREGGPPPPLNLVGDFGGGGAYLALGVVAALLEARRSGQGQVVDAAITDGAASLMAAIYGFAANGGWDAERQSNMLDGGAPFYDTYECADGEWVAIGSIEPKFYELLAEKLGEDLGTSALMARLDKSRWPELKARIAQAVRRKTRAQWCELMEGSDVCFAPVLSMAEAARHPHNRARETLVERSGVVQPAPAPRFSRTPAAIQRDPVAPGADTDALLAEAGYAAAEVDALRAQGAVA